MDLQNLENSPYNTLNIPTEQQINLNKLPKTYYEPTTELVNNYLKDNSSMYDNRGKYFDEFMFNKKFDKYIEEQNKKRILKQDVQLYDLDNISNIKIYPYQLPIDKLLINFKNVWFKLFDDILNNNNISSNFNTDNLFYFGVSFIVFYLLFIFLYFIFE